MAVLWCMSGTNLTVAGSGTFKLHFPKLLAWIHHQALIGILFKAFIYKLSRCEQWELHRKYIYSFVLPTNKKIGYGYGKSAALCDGGASLLSCHSLLLAFCLIVPIISSFLSHHPCCFIIPVVLSSLSLHHFPPHLSVISIVLSSPSFLSHHLMLPVIVSFPSSIPPLYHCHYSHWHPQSILCIVAHMHRNGC